MRLKQRRLAGLNHAVLAIALVPLAWASDARATNQDPLLPLVDMTFDASANPAPRLASTEPTFETQFAQPDFTPGVTGRAWRSDGFSSSVSQPLAISAQGGFTVEAWIALESYPSDAEVPADRLTPASLLQQATKDSGFDLTLDMFGRWGLRVSTAGGPKRIVAPEPFPLNRWVHVAATFDPSGGHAALYLDGKLVAEEQTGAGNGLRPAATPFTLARSWEDAKLGIFRVNGVDAAYDDVRVYGRSLSATEIASEVAAVSPPPASASLVVPASRFADGLQRPVFHAMPPANWTNEPHGLVGRGDTWHMFYQRTPNGPYKTEMHWGHMTSTDLVNWTYLPDALWPTLQTDSFGFDMKGIWSGDVVIGPHGLGYAFYTSVNHTPDIFNPGISVALSADPDLRVWQKRGPIINADGLRDFRDPYVWQQDGEWRMLVGAALPGKGGGVAYYRCANIDDSKCWKKQPRIAPFDQMDIGSDIWEMPVFQDIGGGKYILEANPIGGAVSKYGGQATRAVYWIGRWDGRRFAPDNVQPKMLDILPGHLSPTVERDASGHLIGIGIVDERRSAEAQKRAGWAHTFSLPRVWRLLADGETLGQSPWPGLAQLRDEGRMVHQTVGASTGDHISGDLGRSSEWSFDFGDHLPASAYGVILAASADGSEITRLTYDPSQHAFTLDKTRSTLDHDGEGPMVLSGSYDVAAFGPPRTFHVYFDHSVVDVFINDAAAFSFRIYPSRPDSSRVGVTGPLASGAKIDGWAMRPSRFTTDLTPTD